MPLHPTSTEHYNVNLWVCFEILVTGLVNCVFVNWLCPLTQGHIGAIITQISPNLSPAPQSLFTSDVIHVLWNPLALIGSCHVTPSCQSPFSDDDTCFDASIPVWSSQAENTLEKYIMCQGNFIFNRTLSATKKAGVYKRLSWITR